MSKREIIIILLAAAIGVYGLLDYFVISAKTGNGEDEAISEAVTEVISYATQIQAKLTGISTKKEFKNLDHLISKAESRWPSDPFIEYEEDDGLETDQVVEEELPELLYTGFIKAGHKLMAVINGMEYTIGELLKDVGYKVSKISSSRVVLLTEANKEIILQLKEN